jgi:two-component system, NarL family, sensor histidine kinase DesK
VEIGEYSLSTGIGGGSGNGRTVRPSRTVSTTHRRGCLADQGLHRREWQHPHQPRRKRLPALDDPGTTVLADEERGASRRLVRLAEISVVAFVLASPVLKPVAFIGWPDLAPLAPGAVTTALMVPLLLLIVWPSMHGRPPAAPRATLAGMVVVAIAGTALTGPEWSVAYGSLGLAVLLVLRPPWSWVTFAVVVASVVPLSRAYGYPTTSDQVNIPLEICRALAPYTMIRLIGLVRRLDAARAELAGRAVEQERLRVDDELRRTVGAGLDKITAAGADAAGDQRDADLIEQRLRALVAPSLGTLAEVRRLISGLQRGSLRSELDTMATLLRAVGVDATVNQVPGGLPEYADEQIRAALRSATTQLLRDDDVRTCVVTVHHDDGSVVLDVTADGISRLTTEVHRA